MQDAVTEARSILSVPTDVIALAPLTDKTSTPPVLLTPLYEPLVGAQVTEVDEPLSGSKLNLFRSEPIFQVEFDVIAEPKALLPEDLRQLIKKYGGYIHAARAMGASEAFVRINSQEKNYKTRRKRNGSR